MNKRCYHCEKHNSYNTDYGSPNEGVFVIPEFSKVLMITDQTAKAEYLISIRYCPFCGKRITST